MSFYLKICQLRQKKDWYKKKSWNSKTDACTLKTIWMSVVGSCIWHLLAINKWTKKIFLDSSLGSLCCSFVIINAKSLVDVLAGNQTCFFRELRPLFSLNVKHVGRATLSEFCPCIKRYFNLVRTKKKKTTTTKQTFSYSNLHHF